MQLLSPVQLLSLFGAHDKKGNTPCGERFTSHGFEYRNITSVWTETARVHFLIIVPFCGHLTQVGAWERFPRDKQKYAKRLLAQKHQSCLILTSLVAIQVGCKNSTCGASNIRIYE